MKKPTKKELLNLLRKTSTLLQTHQMKEEKILKGYTLAANLGEEATNLSNEITSILIKS
jgi:hypothetical protein